MQHQHQHESHDAGRRQRTWHSQDEHWPRDHAQLAFIQSERGVEQQWRQKHEQQQPRVELRQRHQVRLLDHQAAQDQCHGVRHAEAPGQHAQDRRPQQHPGELYDGGLDVQPHWRLSVQTGEEIRFALIVGHAAKAVGFERVELVCPQALGQLERHAPQEVARRQL